MANYLTANELSGIAKILEKLNEFEKNSFGDVYLGMSDTSFSVYDINGESCATIGFDPDYEFWVMKSVGKDEDDH